jgi:hypothetical protein
LGDEVGEGDANSFFAVVDFFRLCGVGVGVGVEKIFLIFSPTDSSAANSGEIVADRIRTDARNVESLRKVGRLCCASFEATLKRRFPSALLY